MERERKIDIRQKKIDRCQKRIAKREKSSIRFGIMQSSGETQHATIPRADVFQKIMKMKSEMNKVFLEEKRDEDNLAPRFSQLLRSQ